MTKITGTKSLSEKSATHVKTYNRSIIPEHPFRFCILRIVKVTADNHFSDRLLVGFRSTLDFLDTGLKLDVINVIM